MEQGTVTSFVLFVLYLAGTAGEEACHSIDMKAILVRLRDFQTKTHDTITAMREQITDLEIKNSGLEQDIKDLKNKTLDLENNERSLQQQNQQQERKIEIMQKQITVLKEGMTGLELDKTVQNLTEKSQQQEIVIEAMQELMKGLTEKDLELDTNVQNLTEKTQEQDTEIEGLKLRVSGEKVAFMVRGLRNTSLPANSIFVFTNEELDTTNSYDNSTGKFTAPVAGNYLFSVQFCLNQWTSFRYKIQSSKTTQNVHDALYRGGHYADCSSVTTIIELKKSESVWVETVSTLQTSYLNTGKDNWNMFLGTLLAA